MIVVAFFGVFQLLSRRDFFSDLLDDDEYLVAAVVDVAEGGRPLELVRDLPVDSRLEERVK